MKISLKWLQNYVDIDISYQELAEKLTKVGLEVENIELPGEKYKDFIIGKVLQVNKHPNADKLTVCEVNIKKEKINVICGAPNVAVGQKVVVGLPGTIIPKNQHDPESKPFTLTKATIRGVQSNGMICSEFELDLGEDKEGILILNEDAKVGTSLAEHLGLNDVIFDIGITPNRPDCLSHIGIVREVACILNKKLKIPNIKFREINKETKSAAKIVIQNKVKCPRYSARVVKNVKILESPKWLKDYLNAVGIRPINNIVDVTNYVLMETGHPLHAFDYDKITQNTIIVREAKDGEYFTTLDGQGRQLQEGDLLICDAEKPIAIAGVMGGLNSEITESTVNILLESAYFDPKSVRRTSKKLGLSTSASQRFERGADPNITKYAIDRAAQLISQISGGEILKGIIDVYPKNIKPKIVKLSVRRVNEILGTNLTKNQIVKILSKIAIKNLNKKTSSNELLSFEIPTFRPDIEREIDLIEEIARLYGYDNIETKMSSLIKFSSHDGTDNLYDELKSWLIGRGYNEIITNSLQKKELASLTSNEFVEIVNPISKDMSAMRTSLLTSMLQVILHNISHQTKNLNLFEIGRKYFKTNSKDSLVEGYIEENWLILAKSGLSSRINWSEKERYANIFDIKGEVEDLFEKILLDKYKFIPYPNIKALVDSAISIEIQGFDVGYIGKINKETLKHFDIEQDVMIAELNIDELQKFIKLQKQYVPLPNYPTVVRDIAFILDNSITADEIKDTIKLSGGKLLKSVEIFDLYVSDQIGVNKKSCAFSIELLSKEKTLTDEEIDNVINRITRDIENRYNAILRQKT